MRLCVVELTGRSDPTLAVEREGGGVPLDAPASLREALRQCGAEGLMKMAGDASGRPVALSDIARWLPPVLDPRSFRDFYAFEQHVKTCRAKRGQNMDPTWYDIPVFYFSNTGSLQGHNEPVKRPVSTDELDFELEVGCVIGEEVRDVSGEAAKRRNAPSSAIWSSTIYPRAISNGRR